MRRLELLPTRALKYHYSFYYFAYSISVGRLGRSQSAISNGTFTALRRFSRIPSLFSQGIVGGRIVYLIADLVLLFVCLLV
jgi:hypothetical protein